MRKSLTLAVLIASLALPDAAIAHHSFALFDRTKEVELKQVVVARWEWTNPHIWLDVIAGNGKGPRKSYSIEGGSTGVLRRQGWAKNSLKPGDTVTVYFSPLKNGGNGGSLLAVVFPNGRTLGARIDRQRSTE